MSGHVVRGEVEFSALWSYWSSDRWDAPLLEGSEGLRQRPNALQCWWSCGVCCNRLPATASVHERRSSGLDRQRMAVSAHHNSLRWDQEHQSGPRSPCGNQWCIRPRHITAGEAQSRQYWVVCGDYERETHLAMRTTAAPGAH